MTALTTRIVTQMTPQPVLDAAKTAEFRNLGHAAASIRKDAVASIKTSDEPSPPGEPPHTRGKGKRRRVLPRAIRFEITDGAAVIGPRASIAGQAGEPHEHGGTYRGQAFPRRPTMLPALQRAAPRIGSRWAGTIGAR